MYMLCRAHAKHRVGCRTDPNAPMPRWPTDFASSLAPCQLLHARRWWRWKRWLCIRPFRGGWVEPGSGPSDEGSGLVSRRLHVILAPSTPPSIASISRYNKPQFLEVEIHDDELAFSIVSAGECTRKPHYICVAVLRCLARPTQHHAPAAPKCGDLEATHATDDCSCRPEHKTPRR